LECGSSASALSLGSPAPVVAGEAKDPPEKAVPEAPHSKALPGTCPDKIGRAAPVVAIYDRRTSPDAQRRHEQRPLRLWALHGAFEFPRFPQSGTPLQWLMSSVSGRIAAFPGVLPWDSLPAGHRERHGRTAPIHRGATPWCKTSRKSPRRDKTLVVATCYARASAWSSGLAANSGEHKWRARAARTASDLAGQSWLWRSYGARSACISLFGR